jgi:hypothetical protein
LTTKGWHQRCGRNDCPYCSEPVFVAANARGRRARTSVNLAIKEQLEQFVCARATTARSIAQRCWPYQAHGPAQRDEGEMKKAARW